MSKNKKMANLGLIIALVGGLMVPVGIYMFNKYSGKSRAEDHKQVIGGQEKLSGKIDSNSKEIINKIDSSKKPANKATIKNETKNEINAPNALIVTQNQSGGQNTVNNYVTEIEKPRITFISKKAWPNKELPPFPNCPISDPMYKTTIDFQYHSQIPKEKITIIVEKEPSVECVHVFYAGDQLWSVKRDLIQEPNIKGVTIFDPKNEKFVIAIYSKKEVPNISEKVSILIDSVKYSIK